MNVFLREMKMHWKGLLFWSLGMLMLVVSGMAKFSAYEATGTTVEELLSAVPKTIQVIFGFSGFDLTTASGFYGVLFLYIAVMAAVHAALLGAHVIAEEERDRTSEFLYAKPVSRARVLTGKLLAGLLNVLVLNAITLASSVAIVDAYNHGESATPEILVLMAGLLLLQLTFFAIGAAVAGIGRRPKAAASLSTSIMFFTFLVYYLVNLDEKLDLLKYLSPFKYFDAAMLMRDGSLDPLFVGLSLGIIALCAVGTYRLYGVRDLSV